MTRLFLELKKIQSNDKKLYMGKIYGKNLSLIIDSVIDHNNILKYNSLPGSSYIKLPKELDHPRKGLINVQNIDDNECCKWCLVK